MTVDELVKHFGSSSRAADALGVKPQHVSNWKARGRIPEAQQYKIERLTGGKLVVTIEKPDCRSLAFIEKESQKLLKTMTRDGYNLSFEECKKIVLRKIGINSEEI